MARSDPAVWCVCVGDGYTSQDVQLLRDQVSRHLPRFDFWCISDRPRAGIDCVIPADIARFPGWWAKLLLFRYARTGRNLYIDLDAVVVGDLAPLLSVQLSAPANWAQSGHGGIQSSVMAWGQDYAWITQLFEPDNLRADPTHPYGRYGQHDWWGDQGFLTAMLGDPGGPAVHAMQGVVSYKYHCQHGLPSSARVVAFHGLPKPADVKDAWVRSARSTAIRT